jgi:hypothetical protein
MSMDSAPDLCAICEEELPEGAQHRESLVVSPCYCRLHKVCYLDLLAKQYGDSEWLCPVCLPRRRVSTGYSCFSVSTKQWQTETLGHKPGRHGYDADGYDGGAGGGASDAMARKAVSFEEIMEEDLNPLKREFEAFTEDEKKTNCYLSIMFRHPEDVGNPKHTLIECIMGQSSDENAKKVLEWLMLFLNYCLVQPAADIVQPPLHSMNDVLTAAVHDRSLLHRLVHILCTREMQMAQSREELATAEQESVALAVYAIAELIVKVERPHRPLGRSHAPPTFALLCSHPLLSPTPEFPNTLKIPVFPYSPLFSYSSI